MSGATLLGVLIGLVFLYLLLSTLCSTLTSAVAHLLKLRVKGLRRGIDQLISEPNLREAFYHHPLITSLAEGKSHVTIPRGSYALALLDTAAQEAQKLQADGQTSGDFAFTADVQQLSQLIGKLPPSSTRTLLLTFLASSEKEIDGVLNRLGESYDATMQTVSRWYKKQIRWFLLGFAALVCFGLNIDSIAIAEKLWADSTLRQAVDTAATSYLKTNASADDTPEDIQRRYQSLVKLHLPIGWSAVKLKAVSDWPSKLIGLLLTVIATSAGAPFWYDALNRLVGFRDANRSTPG